MDPTGWFFESSLGHVLPKQGISPCHGFKWRCLTNNKCKLGGINPQKCDSTELEWFDDILIVCLVE